VHDFGDRPAGRPANLPSAAETEDLLARLAAVRAGVDSEPAAEEASATEEEASAPPGRRAHARPGREPGGRRNRLLVTILLLTVPVLAAVAAGGWWLLPGDRRAAGPGASPSAAGPTGPDAAGPGTPTAASGLAATPAPTPTATLPWPGTTTGLPAGLPASGPGVTEPGEEVTVAPGSGIALEVYERVVLPAGGADAAELVAPDLTEVASLPLPRPVWVRDLEVTTDGLPARTVLSADGWTVRAGRPGQTFLRFTARYRLTNGVVLQPPLAQGGPALVATPLWATEARRLGATVLIRTDTSVVVRNVACPGAAPCASGTGADGPITALLPPGTGTPVVVFRTDLSGSPATGSSSPTSTG
jgi:hypothetical protein